MLQRVQSTSGTTFISSGISRVNAMKSRWSENRDEKQQQVGKEKAKRRIDDLLRHKRLYYFQLSKFFNEGKDDMIENLHFKKCEVKSKEIVGLSCQACKKDIEEYYEITFNDVQGSTPIVFCARHFNTCNSFSKKRKKCVGACIQVLGASEQHCSRLKCTSANFLIVVKNQILQFFRATNRKHL